MSRQLAAVAAARQGPPIAARAPSPNPDEHLDAMADAEQHARLQHRYRSGFATPAGDDATPNMQNTATFPSAAQASGTPTQDQNGLAGFLRGNTRRPSKWT